MSYKGITVYSTTFCADCIRAKMWLDSHNISYKDINIEDNNKAIDLVTSLNNGFRKVPTIIFPDGSILAEPTNKELEEKFNA